jgi:CHASE1-domain containing sensor protein
MSTAETLTGIFFEPSRTFEALRARPRFLVAALILLALACLVTLILYMRVDMGQYMRERD